MLYSGENEMLRKKYIHVLWNMKDNRGEVY